MLAKFSLIVALFPGSAACATTAAVAPGGPGAGSPGVAAAAPGDQPATPAAQPAGPTEPEARLRIELLDNGAFAELNDSARDLGNVLRIPWWRSTRGMEQVVELDASHSPRILPRDKERERAVGYCARTGEGEHLEQPLACYAPYARSLRVQGQVRGHGRVLIRDGSGATAPFEFGPTTGWQAFEITGEQLAQALGREPQPRFVLRCESARAGASALWRGLSASAEFPCPSEAALREELGQLLEWSFRQNIEHGIDAVGPLRTGYWTHDFDAVTGARLETLKVSMFMPIFDQLRTALAAREQPAWRAAYDQFLGHFTGPGLHPDTGLPRSWDCELDTARDDVPQEIALSFAFLIDIATSGDAKWSGPARAAAQKIGQTVLERGILPDGNIAASYLPATGATNPNVGRLRRLDVLAQLARLGALTGDERYLTAVREALATFEYTHLWTGSWQQIDPAFDDEFGHYGARAVTAWKAMPQEPLFRNLALSGWKHFEPLWKDAIRLGGNCAADQVRCWLLLLDLAELEPREKPAITALVAQAIRAHLKGEQGTRGAWSDLTIVDFDAQQTFAAAVGDFPGAPQNLLHGLSLVYDAKSGLRTDETRAFYTAVLRSSVAAYKRPYGFLIEGERKGPNTAKGTLRLLLGMTKMYAKL